MIVFDSGINALGIYNVTIQIGMSLQEASILTTDED